MLLQPVGVFFAYLEAPSSHIRKIKKIIYIYIDRYLLFSFFFIDFLVYGSWEPLDTQKILPRGVGTFSPIGKAIPRIFQKSTFYIFIEYRLRPKIFAAQSRQIAELGRPAYTPKRAERPIYWKDLPHFFKQIRESRVIAFSVGKHVQKPKVTDLPNVE